MAGSLICESPLAKICQNASRGPALSRESSHHYGLQTKHRDGNLGNGKKVGLEFWKLFFSS